MLRLWSPDSVTADPAYSLRLGVLLILGPDETAFLIDLDGGYYGLARNAVHLLMAALTLHREAAVAQIAARFDLTPSEAARKVQHLVAQLGACLISAKQRQRTASTKLERGVAIVLFALTPRCLPFRRWRVKLLLCSAWISIRLVGFGTTLRRWTRSAVQCSPPTAPAHSTHQMAELVSRGSLYLPIQITCKERALCLWRLLHESGTTVELKLGIDTSPLQAHLWCELNGEVLGDDAEYCARFTPVVDFAMPPAER